MGFVYFYLINVNIYQAVKVIETRLTKHCSHIYQIYWSNVLTERFSILYKNQTKEDTSF